jgi:MoxR-like ATPase
MERYMANLVNATRIPAEFGPDLPRWVQIGASPRASLALDRCGRSHAWMHGRDYVDPEDVRAIAPDVLRHRLKLSYEGQGEGVTPDRAVAELVRLVALP